MSMSFLNIMLCYCFSLEAVFHRMTKKTLAKINRRRNSDDIEACGSVKTRTRENVKFTVTYCKDRFKL